MLLGGGGGTQMKRGPIIDDHKSKSSCDYKDGPTQLVLTLLYNHLPDLANASLGTQIFLGTPIKISLVFSSYLIK